MVRVVREWLGIDRITDTAQGRDGLPQLTTGVRTSMDTESKKLHRRGRAANSTGTVGELLSANWSIVDSTAGARSTA